MHTLRVNYSVLFGKFIIAQFICKVKIIFKIMIRGERGFDKLGFIAPFWREAMIRLWRSYEL
jgi:hypothetical protein